jgi:Flp pilus assembly protein TadG
VIRRTSKGEQRRGAAMAEMAILLPFVVFLFLVAVDFCRVFNCTQTVQGCAYAGALYASGYAQSDPGVTPEDAAKQAALAEGIMLEPALRTEDVAVAFTKDAATVTVTYDFRTLTGFPGLPRTLRVVKAVRMELAPKVGGPSSSSVGIQ